MGNWGTSIIINNFHYYQFSNSFILFEVLYYCKEARKKMDIFEVLSAISKRKKAFINSGINEHEALMKAEFDVSKEYHIPLFDIRKLVKA